MDRIYLQYVEKHSASSSFSFSADIPTLEAAERIARRLVIAGCLCVSIVSHHDDGETTVRPVSAEAC